jgi:hypothetical protein
VIQAGANDATAAVFQPEPLREETIARAARAVIAIGEDARRAGASQVIVLTIVPPIDLELWKRALMGSKQEELMTRIGNAIDSQARAEGMAVLDANLLFHFCRRRLARQTGPEDYVSAQRPKTVPYVTSVATHAVRHPKLAPRTLAISLPCSSLELVWRICWSFLIYRPWIKGRGSWPR